ncbi:MAG TPA: DUF4317 domain-containing protein [Candidatus Flavonifractor merdigallinarum]|uniref:DUF4317 domain-containing protein n=1 Tax=Candidatus Flavonifractor merdigallinarum TaxID=2838589 RepID=A0A9D1Y7E4_9FIRM|nr:DUF4317 domain-containing protein [Candidatus Flavonifractor merdigallinarum]
MKEKEIAELRRRFRQDKSAITHVRGCYINENREIVGEFQQSLALMSEEEGEKVLALLRRTLTGGLGRNLLDIEFTTAQVADSEEHRLLMALRDDAGLEDQEVVERFYQKAIASLELEGSYLILLARDRYDVPYRAKDGERQDDGSDEVFTYLVCAVCPVKLRKSALGYDLSENALHSWAAEWLVAAPEVGFLFPAFDQRSTNLYGALYYTKDCNKSQESFVDAVFRAPLPMPADQQRETFQTILADVLEEEDDSFQVVQAVQEELRERIEAYKESREEEPLSVSRQQVNQILASCGVSQTQVAAFDQQYEMAFGEETRITPQNLMETKRLEISAPGIVIQVAPEESDRVQTRIIDGVKYILIRADGDIQVNGVEIRIG